MDQIELMGLGTEMRNPDTMNLDEMSPMEIISAMNREDAGVVAAVAETLPQVAQIVVFATQSLRLGGRIIYIGAGTSGRLGVLDAVECPPTFGVTDQEVIGLIAGGEGAFVRAKEGAEDDEAQGGRDLDAIGLTSRDTVIGLTASGRTPYVLGRCAGRGRRAAARRPSPATGGPGRLPWPMPPWRCIPARRCSPAPPA